MDKTKSASEQFGDFLNDKASKVDVARIIKTLTDFVKEAKKKLEEMFAKKEADLEAKIASIQATVSDTELRTTQRQDQDKETMYSESRTLMRLLEEKIEEVKALIPDATDLSPIDKKIEEVRGLIPSLPEELSPEGIRNKMELFAEAEEDEKMDPRSVRGLAELIEEVKQLKKKSGGSSQMLVSHWPIHEEFTMDGVDTTVTLREAVAAQGTAVFGARYNGQVLDLTTHYTVDGNKISFVGFTPVADSIFSITYLP